MEIGDGHTALFWEDCLLNGTPLKEVAPCLYQLIPTHTRATLTVRQALTQRQWVRGISGGMSANAIVEFLHVTPPVLHRKSFTKTCHEHHVYVLMHVIKCVDQFL